MYESCIGTYSVHWPLARLTAQLLSSHTKSGRVPLDVGSILILRVLILPIIVVPLQFNTSYLLGR